jgi:hypothetical protein
MKRRQAIQALLGTPVLTALPAAEAAPQIPRQPDEMPKLALTTADAAADASPKLFTPQQMAALRRLADLMVPAGPDRPGANDAKAPEFLDFLVSQSAHGRQVLYANGLDLLQLESGKRFHRRFEDLDAEQAGELVGSLHGGTFLHAVRDDLLTATFNSREYAEAQKAAGRRAGGMGTYWYPIE